MRTRCTFVVALIAIVCVGAAGCGSVDPTEVVVDTVPPVAIEDVTAALVSGAIEVTWTASSEVDVVGYHVFRSVNGTPPNLAASVNTNSYTDVSLGSGIGYRYDVAPYDASGNVGAITSSAVVVRDNQPVNGPRDVIRD